MTDDGREPEARRHRILVVDDERQPVSAVKHLLRRQYEVLGATRAKEGLVLLDDGPVAVVLCDQRMPEITGDAFFAEARRRHPNTIRILITAYADIRALVRTINDGHIFGYVAKPWSPEELEHMVARAVEHHEALESNRLLLLHTEELNRKLSKANDELRAFTHVVAHDLKEPLRTIAAYTQFLRSDLTPRRARTARPTSSASSAAPSTCTPSSTTSCTSPSSTTWTARGSPPISTGSCGGRSKCSRARSTTRAR